MWTETDACWWNSSNGEALIIGGKSFHALAVAAGEVQSLSVEW